MTDPRETMVDAPDRPLSTADLAGAATPARPAPEPGRTSDDAAMPLFPADQVDALRSRWQEVQAGFVDEPRRAVEQADELVASAMKTLAETFAAERANLEHQWDRGEDISTEDLRVALQRYRAFFGRLVAV